MVTQQNVDDVAAYIEAASELKAETFFGEDEHIILIGGNEGEFGTPANLKSALAPFRRMWMQGEPCYFEHVHNILYTDCRHEPTRRHIASIRDQFKGYCQKWQILVIKKDKIDLTPADMVDLWLNTRFAHVGRTPRQGRFTPADFAKYEKILGAAKMEFVFRCCVRAIGYSFLNLLQVAETAMKYWQGHQGLNPTHPIRLPFGTVGTEIGPNGDIITRDTPGWSPSNETPDQRFQRLLRRHRFDHLLRLVQMLQPMPGDEVRKNHVQWRHVIEAKSVEELLTTLGFTAEYVEKIEDHDPLAGTLMMDIKTFRKGEVERLRTGVIKWTEAYMPILNDTLAEFQEVFKSQQ